MRVYAESGGTWTQVGNDIDGEAGDRSGHSVSMSSDGKRVAIGAPYDYPHYGGSNGLVRVYAESDGTWTQVGTDIDGEADDVLGWAVSMSSDGTRVAISASRHMFRSSTGHVRVFSESGGTWAQVGANIDSSVWQTRIITVSMSSDGARVAIGDVSESADMGKVHVFAESKGTWTKVGDTLAITGMKNILGTQCRCPQTARAWRLVIRVGVAAAVIRYACTRIATGRGPRWQTTSMARQV